MKFDVLTLFPETINNACDFSIIKRALTENRIEINTINPRDFSKDKHKKVDDTGDFVLTGGEFPALCIIDSVTRLLKGVLGDDESAEYDSHYDGLLEHPHYTKPREYEDLNVPEILLSGNHEKIREWRRLQQFLVTKKKRPDLFLKFLNSNLSEYDKKILKKNNLF